MPPIDEYESYLSKIWESGQLTNQGPLLKELESKLQEYLDVENFHFVSNGTIALQLALRALNITEGEIITTPFSYVATTSSILWEHCKPVFVDIESDTYCIDPSKIEASITKDTKAIMAVHVFGNPCDIEAIQAIAEKHNLKVIYDSAHAFGVQYKGKSIFSYGDISTCSFHATKVFHTIEGGGIFTKSVELSERIELLKRFGHHYDEHVMLGINAKASELQAAMGLVNLNHIEEILTQRKEVFNLYDKHLNTNINRPAAPKEVTPNYAYYPIVFNSEKELLSKLQNLAEKDIYPRRYFYPSLNKLPYLVDVQSCPVSEDIASRIVCLPMYPGLEEEDVIKICEVINR